MNQKICYISYVTASAYTCCVVCTKESPMEISPTGKKRHIFCTSGEKSYTIISHCGQKYCIVIQITS